ncbi:MAG: RNA polymerase sigma factor [Bacillota bacterium]
MDPIETAVQGIKNGDIVFFEVIIVNFQQQLFRYCYHMLGNIHEAEDAVQESFIKAYENIKNYSSSVSFQAWLYKITYNHCINIIRRKRLVQFLPFLEETSIGSSDLETRLEENEFSEALCNGLKKLPPQDRTILILRTIEGKSFKELGVILNMKPATIRKKYERSKNKLRKFLKQKEGGNESEVFTVNR